MKKEIRRIHKMKFENTEVYGFKRALKGMRGGVK